MLTIFVEKIKQQMFYWLWELKSNTLINNHFIIKYFDYMVWSPCAVAVYSSVIFHNVTVFQCYSLYFNTLLARYTEVNANMNISF